MPIRQAPVSEVLADLAHALRMTDMTWPRNDDEDFLGDLHNGMKVNYPKFGAALRRIPGLRRAMGKRDAGGSPHGSKR